MDEQTRIEFKDIEDYYYLEGFDKTIDYLDNLIKDFPDDNDYLMFRIVFLYNAGKYDLALSHIDDIIERKNFLEKENELLFMLRQNCHNLLHGISKSELAKMLAKKDADEIRLGLRVIMSNYENYIDFQNEFIALCIDTDVPIDIRVNFFLVLAYQHYDKEISFLTNAQKIEMLVPTDFVNYNINKIVTELYKYFEDITAGKETTVSKIISHFLFDAIFSNFPILINANHYNKIVLVCHIYSLKALNAEIDIDYFTEKYGAENLNLITEICKKSL